MTMRVERGNGTPSTGSQQPAPRRTNLCEKVVHAWDTWKTLHTNQIVNECEYVCSRKTLPKQTQEEYVSCMQWCFRVEVGFLRDL